MPIQNLMVQLLVCADARIAMEAAGHRPKPEVRQGRDTGRVAHTWDEGDEEIVIHFADGHSETVVFKGCFADAR